MAAIDQLLQDVPESLRARLLAEISRFREPSRFGLQFERHVPEYLAIPSARIRLGARVALRGKSLSATMIVTGTDDHRVKCEVEADGSSVEHARSALVVVRRFGEPVFPALRHVESVVTRPDRPHHVLIEGENHSVLQLLEWTTRASVDCIYIDPPYNTGSTKWRYNNHFVDKDDAFRSSKWLSMMERRLRIARRLLKDDGILIVAIDDYEFAHLKTLINSPGLFRGWDIDVVVVQNNPRGGGGNHVSNTHEYALFVVPPGRSLFPITKAADEKRDFRRRGRGDNNRRSGRPNSFFAIHVHPETREVVGVGPEIGVTDPYDTGPTPEGLLRVYPMGRNSLERVWRNSRETVETGLRDGSLILSCTLRGTIIQHIRGEQKEAPIPSVWTGPAYNAGEQGTNLVQALTGVEFPYPKAIYTVLDCLRAAVGGRKQALILDFFGGSGTTAHAAELLNISDGGNRQCLLVTNNEVGPEETARLMRAGHVSGDAEWEDLGICRSVTFPRLRNAVQGKFPDGRPISWDFNLGQVEEREGQAEVTLLAFIMKDQATTVEARKHLAAFAGVTQKALLECGLFYIPAAEGSRDRQKGQAMLLDPDAEPAFIDALAEADHIERVFVVTTGNKRLDRALVMRVQDALPTKISEVAVVRNASAGLPANLSYFRMEYLDPAEVEIGARLDELLPTLWLMSGGQGEVPLAIGTRQFAILPTCRFALLLDRAAFRQFRKELASNSDVKRVFIVEDSPEAFRDMVALLPPSIPLENCVRLYRAYLDNFNINTGDA